MMEREQIVKALECWGSEYGCKGCPLIEQGCFDCGQIPLEISQSIIALIKELTEDKEWAAKRILEADKEITRLKQERADTVRKMQERLHERFGDRAAYTASHCHENIDRIADEMLEGEK
ncbi:MAG: hypothetical protein J6W31_05860 [Clostridia bacterium]|nr:hypothetical protein [Clostridia bacterium]